MNQIVDKISDSITNIPHFNVICTVFIMAIFVYAGIMKSQSFAETHAGISEKIGNIIKNVPDIVSKVLTGLTILIEIGAPIAIIYSLIGTQDNNKRLIRNTSLLVMIVFTIIATALYHNPMDKGERMSFLRNVCIVGAFALMLKHLND